MIRVTAGLALACVIAATGCATMNVSSHVERGVNFAAFKTYDWTPADALPVGDPRLDNNPFFRDYLQGAIEKQMARKGYRRTGADAPDLLLHYHATVNQRMEINAVDRQAGYCYDDCGPQVIEYEEGTLVLDVVDARTKRVIWRGWAQDSVEGIIDDQARLERQVDKAVTRIFERFPAGF
jgi:hypothetical protein